MALAIFSEERRKWWTLAAVSFGLFMIMLDNTVVNVALPAIQEDLGASLSQLQWIVAGSATFTTVLSSMIMKSPKETAASVHHFLRSSEKIASAMRIPSTDVSGH